MKKSLILFVLIIAVIFAFSGCTKVEKTVFVFDGTEVSMKEYNFFYKQLVLQVEQSIPAEEIDEYWNTEVDGITNFEAVKQTAYNELMNLYIVAKKAEKSGFTYTDEVVQMATTIKNQFTGGSAQGFYEMTDTDLASVNQVTRLYAIREALCQKLIDDGAIDLSEESIKKEFEERYYKAQHILVTTVDDAGTPFSNEQKAEKLKKAEQILARVNNGENFTNLANELSEDPGQATSPDGYVFTDGEMVKEFEDSVKSLEIGKNSGIVETSYGYHIIKRLPLSYENDSASVTNISQSITSTLITEYLNSYTDEWKKEFDIVENKDVIDSIKR